MTAAVPSRLESRPRQGGLVVPWVSVQLADGTYDFGNMHNARASICLMQSRCQIDGDKIAPQPLVFFVSEASLDDMTTQEPPVHPECAAYSRRACPMVAGQMKHYRGTPSRSHGPAGGTCFKPGCDCGGWIPTPGQGEPNAGLPAQRWCMVWCRDFRDHRPERGDGGASRGWRFADRRGDRGEDPAAVEGSAGDVVTVGRGGISTPGTLAHHATSSPSTRGKSSPVASANGPHCSSAMRALRTGFLPVAGRPGLRGLLITLLRGAGGGLRVPEFLSTQTPCVAWFPVLVCVYTNSPRRPVNLRRTA